LGYVVIRATVEPFDALLDRRAGGQPITGSSGIRARILAEDLQAVRAGERQIEEDEGVVAGQSSRLTAWNCRGRR
jgi:hypothetical protein